MSLWRLLRREALAPVWRRVHAALERNPNARSVQVGPLDAEARDRLQGLVGWPTRPPTRLRLRLAELDAALKRAEPELDVNAVVEALVGPVVDRKAQHARQAAAEAQMWAAAERRLAEVSAGGFDGWLAELRARGHLKRAARRAGRPPSELLDEALACVAALPADGALLQVLATRCTGDPHALDHGQPLGALVLRAVRALVDWPGRPSSAEARRALWAEAGITTEGLSSHVLVHGLRPVGDGLLARQLREHAERGLARKITLAELSVERIRLPPGAVVHLVENPSVVHEAASRLGGLCRPLICMEGVPTVAVWRLLRMLDQARLRVRADFDPTGVRIVNRAVHRVGAEPWRFDTAHYLGALAQGGRRPPFDGAVIETPWDRALALEMRGRRLPAFEEDLMDALLGDLAE